MPKISVIMPAYNAEKYIAAAIDSVLGQTYGDFEFIILNDCSKDRTEEIILSKDDPRIVYLKNEKNLGVAATLNKGLAVAKGEYIARMDADDISMPERFEKQLKYLNGHSRCGVCGSNTVLFGNNMENSPFIFPEQHRKICGDVLFNSPFAHPSVMIRANVLRMNDLWYDPNFEGAEDYYFWYRVLQVSEGYNIQESLLYYRMHSAQVTQACKEKQFETLSRIKRAMFFEKNIVCTEAEMDVFARVCFGERNLSTKEYLEFVNVAKRLIACTKTGKQQVMWNFAVLNVAILKESNISHGHMISWVDSVYRVQNLAYKLRRLLK